ncbi:uncharacterized protein Z520_00984 [Fonsecaea multimorphosa CBS 102226]|uniref:Poly(A) RNA polymerase mitochondrial-like central palm domain-containing protein n=1 Tax=Fonsecaea multimorphosa CBS 102226 TaxID=1442371 RepID=A0A0D2L0I0_9EURO|nr:uncharacterized protein Z520_00984 [Fonsecaea multimorphosa CBS 102226]KIY02519.1 hypothetical protein Z520_00984 [Fonsecaea multimorphosa CBS 102226]OAL31386.1 hypothetical protein AYO22_00978 [Fonsecaea multimorphosa]
MPPVYQSLCRNAACGRHDSSIYLSLPSSLRRCQPRSLASAIGRLATVHTSSRDPPTTFTTEPNVDIKSLHNTLHAHREANRASVVRKTYKDRPSVRLHDADVRLPSREIKTPVPRKDASRFKRVELAPFKGFKGTSRDLDLLWRINDTESDPPVHYRLPWLLHLHDSVPSVYMSAADRLADEIRAFEKYTSPSKEEQRAADDALHDLEECVKEIAGDLHIDIIGSRATNLADPLSDLDVNISSSGQPGSLTKPAQVSSVTVLNKLYKNFRWPPKTANLFHFRPIEVQLYLKQARVPILLCQHKASGLPIQIQSTPRTYDSREYVKASLKEYPSLRGLFKVIKQLLQMRGLTVGSSGGITSYPLFQMIVAALKFSEGRFHRADIGNQFLFFLDFYSDIDFSAHGISTEPLELFSKSVVRARDHNEEPQKVIARSQTSDRDHSDPLPPTFQGPGRKRSRDGMEYLMTLQDPVNPKNDLGKSGFRINDVQETFIAIRATLKAAMAKWDKSLQTWQQSEQRTRARSLLEPCVGGDYRIYEHERDDLRRLGHHSLEAAAAVLETP